MTRVLSAQWNWSPIGATSRGEGEFQLVVDRQPGQRGLAVGLGFLAVGAMAQKALT